MAASRRGMRDVVLVETGAGPASPTEDPPDQEPPSDIDTPRTRRRFAALRRARWWWTSLAGGLTLLVVAANVVADQRESRRLADLAEVPGALAPLGGPVAERWRTRDVMISGMSSFAGRLLLTEIGTDGSVEVVARDPGTGRALWQVVARPAEDLTATDGTSVHGYGSTCAFPDPDSPSIVCVVVDETTTWTDAAFGESIYPRRAHLLVIDATTGEVRSERPTDRGTSVALIGTDLLTGWFDADGHLVLTRGDALGTETGWTFTSPDPVSRPGYGPPSLSITVREGSILVNAATNLMTDDGGGTGGWGWVLSADGDLVRSLIVDASGGTFSGFDLLPGGSMLTEPTLTADGAAGTRMIDLGTGREITIEGFPTRVTPDDGSLPGLVLMQSATSGSLTAFDPTAGKPRWTAAARGFSGSAVLIDGRVVRAEPDGLTAIDGRTGDSVWATPLALEQPGTLVTDGRVVLLAQNSPAGTGPVLTAYGLDDGRPQWETPLTTYLWLMVVDGRLYGSSGSDFVALG